MKENNILLAEFLGWKAIGTNGWKFQATMPNYISVDVPDFDFRDFDVIDTFETAHDDMKFNSDWNWIMMVVEKIESLGYAVYIKTRGCFIEDEAEKLIAFEFKGGNVSKVEATYNSCIEFVKWYNDTK